MIPEPLPPAPGTTARRAPIPALTGVRFIAALMVLLFHFGAGFAERAHAPGPFVTLLKNGYVGVSLFFMLSGFIITYSYDGRLRSAGDHAEYAVARFSRIYPGYLLALGMMLPFAWPAVTPWGATAVLAMLQAWSVPTSAAGYQWMMTAWTISVELFFYLCAPMLLALLRGASPRMLAAGLGGMALLMLLLAPPTVHPSADALSLPTLAFIPIPLVRLIEFIYGMLLCKLFIAEGERLRVLAATPLLCTNIAMIAAILMLSTAPVAIGGAMLLGGLLLFQLAYSESLWAQLLGSRQMLLLGASSYALYLIQLPVREWLRLFAGPSLSQFLNPFVTVFLSILIFQYCEEPARKWLRRHLSAGRPRTPERRLTPAEPN